MHTDYQARWMSKERVHAFRRSGNLNRGILLDSYRGFIIVEPKGSNLGDREILSPMEADGEISPAWCLDSSARITQARKLLRLDTPSSKGTLVAVGDYLSWRMAGPARLIDGLFGEIDGPSPEAKRKRE